MGSLERIEEFDIIRNNKLDILSLESLFNFYKIDPKFIILIKDNESRLTNSVFPKVSDLIRIKRPKNWSLDSFNESAKPLNLTVPLANNLIKVMIAHFNMVDFDLNLINKRLGFNNISYGGMIFKTYKTIDTWYLVQSIDGTANFVARSDRNEGLEELNDSLIKLRKQNNALMMSIGHKIFGPDFYLNQENLIPDVLDRMKEFDVVKNGKLDEISLNSLFDFYEIEFDSDLFYSLYKYRLTF